MIDINLLMEPFILKQVWMVELLKHFKSMNSSEKLDIQIKLTETFHAVPFMISTGTELRITQPLKLYTMELCGSSSTQTVVTLFTSLKSSHQTLHQMLNSSNQRTPLPDSHAPWMVTLK
jgi:hypothetical protein